MNPDVSLYSGHRYLQTRDGKLFFKKFISAMEWNKTDDIVMDIGCGTGDSTLNFLIPVLPEFKALIAIDVLPSMIEWAQRYNSHPKITYQIADIQKEENLEKWRGKISKVISLLCFHWLNDYEKAFRNVYNLLCETGEAFLYLVLQSRAFDAYYDIATSSKWGEHTKNVQVSIPTIQKRGCRSSDVKELLEQMGFCVVTCEEEEQTFSYESDTVAKKAISCYCNCLPCIPEELREDFKNDYFQLFVKYIGRDANGHARSKYRTLSLHLRKAS